MGLLSGFFTYKTSDFAQVVFGAAKNKVTALLFTWASLDTWGVLTPHKVKNRCMSQNKSSKSVPKLVYYTFEQLGKYLESENKQIFNFQFMTI